MSKRNISTSKTEDKDAKRMKTDRKEKILNAIVNDENDATDMFSIIIEVQ